MIQFNLLPDVKLQFIKTRRLKHLVITVSVIATMAAIGVLVILLLVVDVWQKKSINDTNRDIARYSSQIQSTPSLNKILTVQNQLNSLPALDASKPVISRLFGYISQLTPSTITISTLSLDLTANSITLDGSGDTIPTINQFVDTLKFTTYKTNASTTSNTEAFSNVVLSSFSLGTSAAVGIPSPPTYSITADFNPAIFNSANIVTLNVPPETSTRSSLEVPTVLFAPQPTSASGTNSNGVTP